MAPGQIPWTAHRQPIATPPGEKVRIVAGGRALTFAGALAGWREDEAFRAFTLATLAASPYGAVFWEMPPIRRGALDRPYEYVAVPSAALERIRPDPTDFRARLTAPGEPATVRTFPNLSGDALLVAPAPIAGAEAYGHIAAFARLAPIGQGHELLFAVAGGITTILGRSDRPLWVSTAGLGVPWLHVRLDSRPKYYTHAPYRR